MQNNCESLNTVDTSQRSLVNRRNRLFAFGVIGTMVLLVLVHLLVLIVGLTTAAISSSKLGYVTSGESELSLTETNRGRARKGELIFNEDFSTFDLDRWEHEITMAGGGNGEFQLYHNNRSNSYVKFGKLYIRPTLTADKYGEARLTGGGPIVLGGGAPADQCTNSEYHGCSREGTLANPVNPIMSARIRTLKSFTFKYGKVEVKAKLPLGDWLWPAVWLMPERNQYGGWPASGEIDLMESRGNQELYKEDDEKLNRNIGVESVGSTLHFGPFWPENGWDKAHFVKFSEPGKGFNQKFHLYQLDWTPEEMKFSIDDHEVGKVKPGEGGFWEVGGFPKNLGNPWEYGENSRMAPFDQKFYLIVNVGVGGTNGYFPDKTKGNVRKPWINNSPQAVSQFWDARDDWYPTWKDEDAALQVDYIRVWAL